MLGVIAAMDKGVTTDLNKLDEGKSLHEHHGIRFFCSSLNRILCIVGKSELVGKVNVEGCAQIVVHELQPNEIIDAGSLDALNPEFNTIQYSGIRSAMYLSNKKYYPILLKIKSLFSATARNYNRILFFE